MNTEIKIITPDAATVQKVESFLGDVNKEIEKRINDHTKNQERTKRKQLCCDIICCVLISSFILIAARKHNIDLLLSTIPWLIIALALIIFLGASEVVFYTVYDRKWEREIEKNRNHIAGEDIEKMLKQIADNHSVQYTWRGTQVNKNGDIVTDWDAPYYNGTTFCQPEELIQTILCDGILFISARYWRPIPLFPNKDTGNNKIVIIGKKQDPYVEIWDRCVPLKTIPIDPDSDELLILQKDHINRKFLPVEADEETVDWLINRLRRI